MGLLLLALLCLLEAIGSDRPYEIELEVDGSMRHLVAERSESPVEAARRFCEENGLSLSVEGLPCASTLTEELILRGARYDLPTEPVIRLRLHDDLIEKASTTNAVLKGSDPQGLVRSIRAHIPNDALGDGELQVPLVWKRGALYVKEPIFQYSLQLKKKTKTVLAWSMPGTNHTSYGRTAAAFCLAHRCSYKKASKIAAQLAAAFGKKKSPKSHAQRIILSMSTLPGRIAQLDLTALLYHQTRSADALYLAVPERSTRQGIKYEIPSVLYELEQNEPRFRLIKCLVDWGPATKLIPVLLEETEPETIIITVDDDLRYPPSFVADLVHAATRRPEAAVGFKGYRLPDLDEKASIESDQYRHEHLIYFDSADSHHDSRVHILGGLAGVAYRSGFFDYRRLIDYSNWPGGAFFVDDDWISLVLDEAHIPRLVVGGVPTSRILRDDAVLLPHHDVAALNAPGHAFRNMAFQADLLATARQRNLFRAHAPCSAVSKHPLLSLFDFRLCNAQRKEPLLFILCYSDDRDFIHLLDRFLAHHGQGSLYILCRSAVEASALRNTTSTYTIAIDCGDSITNVFWHLGGTGLSSADFIHIGADRRTSSATGMADTDDFALLTTALGSGLVRKRHTLISIPWDSSTVLNFLEEGAGCEKVLESIDNPLQEFDDDDADIFFNEKGRLGSNPPDVNSPLGGLLIERKSRSVIWTC